MSEAVAPHWRRVGVVGVGLIGGSFAASIKAAGLAERVWGFAPDASNQQALALGLVDEAAGSLTELVESVDLVVLAAPVLQLPDVIAAIAPHLREHSIVMDCASTKQSVIAAARRHLGAGFARFVPAHPIAGSEQFGPTAARVGLFRGARVILSPQPETNPEALARVRATWQALGSRLSELDAAAHDRLYAGVSHWPHAVAFALSAALARSDLRESALQAAGAGLKDTTRIGASSPALWAEILLDNRLEVLRAAAEFQAELDRIVGALRNPDRAALESVFEESSGWRRRLEEPLVEPQVKAGLEPVAKPPVPAGRQTGR